MDAGEQARRWLAETVSPSFGNDRQAEEAAVWILEAPGVEVVGDVIRLPSCRACGGVLVWRRYPDPAGAWFHVVDPDDGHAVVPA